ncbi:hypothetical protein [Spirosoma pulveris]
MKHYLILFIGLLASAQLNAQALIGRNSVRLGVDLTKLDGPDDLGPRYVGRLAHHFRNDRVLVSAELGYMRITSINQPFNDVVPEPNRRERFTADVTLLADLMRHPRHALRLGVGFSAWYRRDDIYRGGAALFSPNGLQAVAINRQTSQTLNTGAHVATEYEWLFDPRWSADVRLRLANLNDTGMSFMLGTGISHRF